jgi:hypothetical protein
MAKKFIATLAKNNSLLVFKGSKTDKNVGFANLEGAEDSEVLTPFCSKATSSKLLGCEVIVKGKPFIMTFSKDLEEEVIGEQTYYIFDDSKLKAISPLD